MIEHISSNNFNPDLMDSFYRLRKRVFIDRLKWDIPTDGIREIDQFDHEDAHYLLLKGQNNEVFGGARLTDYKKPNLTKDIFPHLIEKPLDAGKKILEVSRFAVEACEETIKVIRKATLDLFIEIHKTALKKSIDQIIITCEVRLERLLRMVGWPLTRLGSPVEMDGTYVIVGVLPVHQEFIASIEAWMGKVC